MRRELEKKQESENRAGGRHPKIKKRTKRKREGEYKKKKRRQPEL